MENDVAVVQAEGETKMAEENALTNGHVGQNQGSDQSVVSKSVPKVTESFKSSEKIGENSSDVEKFKSKLTEHQEADDHSVTDMKQYEECALKAMSERTDNSEMSSVYETKLGQSDIVKTSDTGAVSSQVKEDQEIKHETSSKTTESVGDMTATKEQSEKSKMSSSVTVDASSDGRHGVLVDLGNETSSKSFEEIKGDGFRGSRKVESSVSERKMEYTSEGGSGAGGSGSGGKAIDFGKDLDDLFDPTGEYTKKERGSRAQSFLQELAEIDKIHGTKAYAEENDLYSSKSKYKLGEMDWYSLSSISSSSSRHSSKSASRRENSLDEGMDSYRKASWGLSTDRRTADDLIQRVLAESRGRAPPSRSSASRILEEDAGMYSPSSPYSPRSPKFDSWDPEKPDEHPLTSPKSKELPKEGIFKVDMGDGKMNQKSEMEAGVIREGEDQEDIEEMEKRMSFTKKSSTMEHSKSESFEKMSKEGFKDEDITKHIKSRQQPEQQMSLLDRRLASMGFDRKLGQEMYMDKQGKNEGYVETTYISKTKPPGFVHEDDDLDKEIESLRDNYRNTMDRRNRYFEDEDEKLQEANSLAVTSNFKARGRMVRQNYVEGGDAFSYGGSSPRPEDDEDFIPDEDFVPQKRPETEEVVKEKSRGIRCMVDQQSTVLEKLREASNSFDELNDEIRSIKQQLMENQIKRSNIMIGDFDRPDDVYPEAGADGTGAQYGGYRAGSYASKYSSYSSQSMGSYGTGAIDPLTGLPDTYKPYIPRKQRMEMQRSKSLFDDSYMTGKMSNLDSDLEYQQGQRKNAGQDQEGGRLGPMEDDEDDEALRYGAIPQRKAYDYELPDYKRGLGLDGEAGGGGLRDYNSALGRSYDLDSSLSQRRSYDYGYDTPAYSQRKSSYDLESGLSQRKSYDYESGFTSGSSSYASASSNYHAKPKFTRANTLSDFNFNPEPDRFVRHDKYHRPSSFSSRFLDKVREKKRHGATNEEEDSTLSRDSTKPFKSRFLRDSFSSEPTSSSTSASKSSRFSSSISSETSSSTTTSTVALGGSSGGTEKVSSNTEAPSIDNKTESAKTE